MFSAEPTIAVVAGILPPRFKYIRSSTINQWYILSLFSSRYLAFSSMLMPPSRFFTAISKSAPIPPVAASESTQTSLASGYFSLSSSAAIREELYVFESPLESEMYKTDLPSFKSGSKISTYIKGDICVVWVRSPFR